MSRSMRRRVSLSHTDRVFDALVPYELRHLSKTHWTPIDVAIRAATLLCPTPETRVLDVGAGVGKLCIVGALSEVGMWCGVEQHPSLVDAARTLARTFRVGERTMFLHGDALAIDWRGFDAIYLYNPFEAFPPRPSTIDARVLVAHVQDQLAALRDRSRVVTLHGFGGVMPASYELAYQERMPGIGLDLVLWIQHARSRGSARWS